MGFVKQRRLNLEDLSREILEGAEAPEVFGALKTGYLSSLLARLVPRMGSPVVVLVPDAAWGALLEEGLRFFGGEGLKVAHFYPLEHLPFQGMAPSRPELLARLGLLAQLSGWRQGLGEGPDILCVAGGALLDGLPPPAYFEAHRFEMRVGDEVEHEALLSYLSLLGYTRMPQVEDPASFAVRGENIDIWPVSARQPLRLERFGDEIERIRAFDPETQLGGEEVGSVVLSPARSFLLDEESVKEAKGRLLSLADKRAVPSSQIRALFADLDHGILGPTYEELAPAFHDALVPLLAHLPEEIPWIIVDEVKTEAALEAREADLQTRHARALARGHALVFEQEALYPNEHAAPETWQARARLYISGLAIAGRGTTQGAFRAEVEDQASLRREISTGIERGDARVFAPFVEAVGRWREEGAAVCLLAHTEGSKARLADLLRDYPIAIREHEGVEPLKLGALARDAADVHLLVGHPGEGFVDLDGALVVVDESELLSRPARPRPKAARPPAEGILKSWRDLTPGDLIVHLTHGVGRYLGLRTLEAGDGVKADVIEVEYAKENTLMVPVDKLHLVSKHQGGEGSPALDRLGGTGLAKWRRTKAKVKKAVRDIADRLLKLYAEREASEGFAFQPPGEIYQRFEARFPYQETPDQLTAIEDILRDMGKARPMDRLVCGDVGFGKTEVAMRAAMLAVLDGKQVAVLVPTQILAEQHRLTFQERFEGFPVTIASMSSMKTMKENRQVAVEVGAHQVDIVIGTHRLLSKDMAFADLGLLIIDEEHRFGVAHKEQLKQLRVGVDVLTLTATPIPRTLHLSMLGLRDISLIQTPPVARLPVETYITQKSEETIVEAIQRELGRGGQVYIVHHRVFDIDKQAELIQALVPEARVAVGHGQMKRGELEKVMWRFIKGEANVLVATTIIESGIDIPHANTMIINHAEHFGLAQLYQLRGRVGRSSTRAFCYLMIPSGHQLKDEALGRLEVIQRFSELGSGYSVAAYDLDARGAGDLLGADQAGNIDAVGYDAYMDLLQEAIEARQGDAAPVVEDEEAAEPDIRMPVQGRIPESWLPDTILRLRLYRAFARAKHHDEISTLYGAAIDRYGSAPAEVRNLADLMHLKLDAKRMRLTRVALRGGALHLSLAGDGPLSPVLLLDYVQRRAGEGARLTPEGGLVLPCDAAASLNGVRDVLRELEDFASSA